MLRRILAVVLLAACAAARGSSSRPSSSRFPSFRRLRPAPPDQPEEPPVRIRSGQDQVEEQLVDGRHVVRVTTPSGQEYWLVEDLNDGTGVKNESLDHGVRAPLWVIKRF